MIKRLLSKKLCDQLTKFALEKMKSAHPEVALPGVQLLITCIYTGRLSSTQQSGKKLRNFVSVESADRLEKSNSIVHSNPDSLVQAVERISAVFDLIKKGFPFEVEVLCGVLPDILNDFFPPSDILTKVIGEFLSPQQPHPKLLSGVVFKVRHTYLTHSLETENKKIFGKNRILKYENVISNKISIFFFGYICKKYIFKELQST